jgi:hypothetical protein
MAQPTARHGASRLSPLRHARLLPQRSARGVENYAKPKILWINPANRKKLALSHFSLLRVSAHLRKHRLTEAEA